MAGEREATREVAEPADDWPADLVQLYEQQYDGYVRLAFLLCGSREIAEDAVQEAFVAARARWQSIRTSHGGYVRTCVVKAVHARQRRSGIEERHRTEPLPQHAPDDLVELQDALQRLPWAQRVAIVSRYWVELPDDATAELLGCRLGTVRSHISRGVAALRKELTP
jgi:RNA polymerase sigma factor (sigma-70 family)